MVMHARKIPRIADGYYNKHDAHPYQNSKYSSKSMCGERYNLDSPSGNSYRSESPDSQSPRDRSYHNKSSYAQRMRDKERREREYKSRDKDRAASRSPCDRRREYRDSEHRTNHDRPEQKERPMRIGDWSEHISSSGKKYYYNCRTEVSQWEKPREWNEYERNRNKERERNSTSRSTENRHSNSRHASGTSDSHLRDGYRNNPAHDRERPERRKTIEDSQSQDMDISPGDSTPTSENSYSQSSSLPGVGGDPRTNPLSLSSALPRLLSQPAPSTPLLPKTPTCSLGKSLPSTPTPASTPSTSGTGNPPVSLASLLISQITGGKGLPSFERTTDISPQEALQTIQTALLLNKVSNANAETKPTPSVSDASLGPLTVDTGSNSIGGGPPTPTHSEPQDGVDNRKMSSPTTANNLATLSGLAQAGSSLAALRPQTPTLTPSLANYYHEDLISHVKDWPSEQIEKQCQKISDESHILGSIHCTKVSADLKMARSLVRLAEIQATLQEQRILFYRQQIKELEEMKSQNSFMSDT